MPAALQGKDCQKTLDTHGFDDGDPLAIWARILAWESEFVSDVTKKEFLQTESRQILDQVRPASIDTRSEQAFINLTEAHYAINTNLDIAISSAGEALSLFRELGESWGEAEALQILGISYYFRGDFDKADELLCSNLEVAQVLNDTQGIAKTILFLGVVARYQGNFAKAESHHQQSLGLFQKLGNPRGESLCLGLYSYTLAWAGKFRAAFEAVEQAMQIDQELGVFPRPRHLNPSAKAAIHLGHYDKAREFAAESLELARQQSNLAEAGWALMYLGNIAFVEGDLQAAKQYLQECEKTLAAVKHIHLSLPQAILSYIARGNGDIQLSGDYLKRALRSGIEYRTIYPILYSLPIAALLAADDGRTLQAIELYGLAKQYAHITNSRWFESIATRQLEDVRARLAPDIASTAESRGRKQDLWETAEALLHT